MSSHTPVDKFERLVKSYLEDGDPDELQRFFSPRKWTSSSRSVAGETSSDMAEVYYVSGRSRIVA